MTAIEIIEKDFDIVANFDRQRWEFEPKYDRIGYMISFSEAMEMEDAANAILIAINRENWITNLKT